MSSTLLEKETSNHFIYLNFYIGPFHFFIRTPLLKDWDFLGAREVPLKAVSVGVTVPAPLIF